MKKVVVKIGGSLAIDEQKLQDFVRAVVAYSGDDKKICVVHGGGKDINENIALLAEAPTFVEGLRVTTPEIMKMVEMTLSGHVNKKNGPFLFVEWRQGYRDFWSGWSPF